MQIAAIPATAANEEYVDFKYVNVNSGEAPQAKPEDNICAGVTVAELRRHGTAEHPASSSMNALLCSAVKCPLAADMTDAELQACIDK